MKTVTFEVPALYADHHVLAVREALSPLEGVKELYASSAWKQVMVTFDPKVVEQGALEAALKGAGYPVGDGAAPVLVDRDSIGRDPQWARLDLRVTKTHPADHEMVSQFHRR